jgi:hypothetical protein
MERYSELAGEQGPVEPARAAGAGEIGVLPRADLNNANID